MSEAEVLLRQLLSAWIRQYGVTRSDTGATVTPIAPTLTTRIMFNSAYLSWSAQPALTGVETTRIERSDTADFASHTDVATVAGHTYTDEGLALNGTDDVPLPRTYYYRVVRISNGTTESVLPSNVTSIIADSLSPKAIAANAINAAKILAGAIDMGKMATGIRPTRVVAALPANPYTGYLVGDTVVLTSDNKLYRLTSVALPTTTGWTAAVATTDLSGTVSSAQIADGSVSITKMATGLRPPRVVAALPVSPFTGYSAGDTVVLTTDNKLYRFTGTAFTKDVDAVDIVANSITAGQIATGAIAADELAANAVTAVKILAGAVTTDKMTANTISGDRITAGTLDASKITADSITAGQIAAGAISATEIAADAVTAGKILAGSILASKLSVIAADLVNNVTLNGNINGWGKVLEDGSGTPLYSTYDATEKAIKITTSAGAGVRNIGFKVDHSKIYRVSVRYKKSAAHGTTYIGLAASANAITGHDALNDPGVLTELITPITYTTRALGSPVANWYNVSALAGSTSYVEYTFFIVGARRSQLEFPEGANVDCAKLADTTNYLALRFLNWTNTVSTSMYIRDISVTEVGAGIIVAENIKAGAITTDKLAAEAVTAVKIKAGEISTLQLSTGVVTSLGKADSVYTGTTNYLSTADPNGTVTVTAAPTVTSSADGSRNFEFAYNVTSLGTAGADFLTLFLNINTGTVTAPLKNAGTTKITIPLAGTGAGTYKLTGVAADLAVGASISISRNTSAGIKHQTAVAYNVVAVGTVSITAGGTFSGTASGNVSGTVNSVAVATLTAQASAGNTANTNTATFQLTTNPNGSFSLGAISSALNTDGSMDVTATWRYTESTVASDFILLVLNKAATAPTALVGYQSVYLAKGTNATTYSYVFRGLPAGTYSCGIVAGRYSAAGEKYTAIYSTSMINTTQTANITAAIGGTALINSVAASTVTGGAANGATSYTWLNAGAANGTTAGHNTVALVQNADGSVNLDLSWGFTQGTIVADRLLVAIKKGTTNPGAVALSDITSGLVDVYEYPVGATAAKIAGLPIAEMVAGVSTKLIYSVGIACAKPSISGATVISAVNSPAGWQNKTVTAVTMGANADNFWDLTTGEFLSTIGTDKTFHLDPGTGDAELTNIPIRSYQGSGVQRRATQLDNDSLDFLDCPTASPDDDILRARIGRLGVGGAVLMDGEILANIESTWKTKVQLPFTSIVIPSLMQDTSGLYVMAYTVGSAANISVVTSLDLISWSSAVVVEPTLAMLPIITQDANGRFLCLFTNVTTNNLKIRSSLDLVTWDTVVEIPSSNNRTVAAFLQLKNGLFAYTYSDGTSLFITTSSDLVSWSTPITIAVTTYNGGSFIQNDDGIYIAAYSSTAGSYLKTSTDLSTWSAPVTLAGVGTVFANLVQALDGKYILLYGNLSYEIHYKSSYDLLSWTGEGTLVATSAIFSRSIQAVNGNVTAVFSQSGSLLYTATLQRYAQIGAGIIESGSNSNGSWIKYGDGTMECWHDFPRQQRTGWTTDSGYYFTTWYWTYPESFVSGSIIAGFISGVVYQGGIKSFTTSTDLNVGADRNRQYCEVWGSTNTNPYMDTSVRAIGRWKA